MTRRVQSVRSLTTAAIFALALLSAAVSARAPAPSTEEIAVTDLPREAREVLVQIKADGPFRYERDGVVFGNREHRLPPQSRGYYREYTVPTPGVKSRGGRRIVCGGPRTVPNACYYTSDHYQTFRRIRE
jgi:ribonuclease T1